ncbi:MAG: SIR2 family protein [Gammaproteobacteria bacterium]|nr:SIR2 family protein [Gammaproteobacteria bacterium]
MNKTKVFEFLSNATIPVLFAGAGVSAKAGLPTWGTLLKELAEQTRQYNTLTRQMMVERIAEHDLVNAATYFFSCPGMTINSKFMAIRSILGSYDSNGLQDVMKIPFRSVVTTNYDRALHDAYSYVKRRSSLEFHGDKLNQAEYERDFYIARIHGAIEDYDSIVMSEEHYRNINNNDKYCDFLTHMFTTTNILFVGFSFLDPAIKNVLNIIYDKYGGIHNGSHLALVPNNAQAELVSEFDKFSIEKIHYNSENNHKQMWDCLRECANRLSQGSFDFGSYKLIPFKKAELYLSSCYARTKLGPQVMPLKDAIIEGIISQLIISSGIGAARSEIYCKIHESLVISQKESKELVDRAIFKLTSEGLCQEKDNRFVWIGKDDSIFNESLEKLINGVIDRFIVRYGGQDKQEYRDCLLKVFEKLILYRGWDLGAAYAKYETPDQINIRPIFNEETPNISNHTKQSIFESLEDLLNNPSTTESRVLAELGRISFGLEVVFQSPHDTLFHSLTLPDAIYLDANVLMPAITKGHPYYQIYVDTIESLVNATSESGKKLNIYAYGEYLKETVRHKNYAETEIESMGDRVIDMLRDEVVLFGHSSLNVFIAGYLNYVARDKKLTFNQYLKENAPYNSIKSMVPFIKKKGIETIEDKNTVDRNADYPGILNELEKAYVDDSEKSASLIQHDAKMLSMLNYDLQAGKSSLFITADNKLKKKIEKTKYSSLSNYMMSHIGLSQLVDLLVGTKVHSGITKLLWSTQVSSDTEKVKNLLISKALHHYDEGLAMSLPDKVESVAEDIVIELNKKNLDLSTNDAGDREKIFDTIGSFEEKFYEGMRAAIEKKRLENNE